MLYKAGSCHLLENWDDLVKVWSATGILIQADVDETVPKATKVNSIIYSDISSTLVR